MKSRPLVFPWAAALVTTLACSRPADAPPADAGTADGPSPLAPSPPTHPLAPASAPSLASAPAPAPTRTAPSPPAPLFLPGDAGSSCRTLRGPVELPLRSSAALAVRPGAVDAVFNQEGHPFAVSFPAGPLPRTASANRETLDSGMAVLPSGADIPCALADDAYFCPDRTGAVHRSTRGDGDRVVASARPRSSVAAAVVGGVHTVLTYLASRQTSEGWVTEAWIESDDEPPVRLSEDGSGATSVALAARGAGILALTVDARAALTAMHGRPVAYDRRLHLGEDEVLFVGGPGDRRTAAKVAVVPSGAALALLPIARDVSDFGLALVTVEDPPRVDEPVTWSLYANGIDPAPLAIAADARRAWLLRVRPQSAEPRAPQVVELGVLGGDKTPEIMPRAVLAAATAATYADLAVDAFGALWATWVDTSGSWIERLACP